VRLVGTAVLRTDERSRSTQNPVLLLVCPAAIDSPDADSTVKRVPERLNVPLHLSLKFTVVGRSNPIVYFETLVEPLFVTSRLPHQPLLHFSS